MANEFVIKKGLIVQGGNASINTTASLAPLTLNGNVTFIENSASTTISTANRTTTGKGGALYLQASTGFDSGSAGGEIFLYGGTGANKHILTTGAGGAGGAIKLYTGNGGSANVIGGNGNAGGAGGDFNIEVGDGGDGGYATGSFQCKGGDGGAIRLYAGYGGDVDNSNSASGNILGGNAGGVYFFGGAGGDAKGSGSIPGAGGLIELLAGSGGSTGKLSGNEFHFNNKTGSVGANVNINAGYGGGIYAYVVGGATKAGKGGDVIITGGSGNDTFGATFNYCGDGGNIIITPGTVETGRFNAGTASNAGHVYIQGATLPTFNSGVGSGTSIYISPGLGTNATVDGNVLICPTSSVGKVGIGTIIPVNRLDVVGNISCSIITASLFYGTASVAISASYAPFTQTTQISGSWASSSLSSSYPWVGRGSASYLATGLTNVGIGTTIPETNLHIYGINAFQRIEGSNVCGLQFKDPNTYVNIGTYNDKTLRLYASDTSFDAGGQQFVLTSNGYVGIGTSTPTHKLEVLGDDYRLSNTSVTKEFQVSFTNTANEKIDFYITGTQYFQGKIEVTVADTFNSQNATGYIKKVYGVGLFTGGTIYTNESRYTEVLGATGDNYALSPISWDSTNSRYKLTLVHRVSTLNNPRVCITLFAANTSIINIASFAMGTVYTTDTTVYDKPYEYFNNRVGIGTSTPRAMLDVVGDISVTNITASAISASGLISSYGVTSYGEVTVLDGPNLITNGTFTSDINGWTQINGAVLSATASRLRVTNPTLNTSQYGSQFIASGLIVGQRYKFDWELVYNSENTAYVFAGISISDNLTLYETQYLISPIAGTAYFTAASSSFIVLVGHYGTSGSYAEFDNISLTAVGKLSVGTTEDNDSKVDIRNNSGVNTLTVGSGSARVLSLGFDGGTGDGQIKNINNTDLEFFTNGVDRLHISSNGNVAIGITDPDVYKLRVYQNTAADLTSIVQNAYSGYGAFSQIAANSYYANMLFTTLGGTWMVGHMGTVNFVIRDDTNAKNVVGIERGSPANSFYISSSGNIGLNTTTPGSKLTISKPAEASTYHSLLALDDTLSLGNTSAGIDWTNSQFSWQQGRISTARVNSYDFDMIFSTAASGVNAERMRILGVNGNVGIGTTTPHTTLTVQGAAGVGYVNIGQLSDVTYAGGINFNTGSLSIANYSLYGIGADLFINRSSGNSIYFRENNSNQMMIQAGGNVGIGTIVPSASLTITKDTSYGYSPDQLWLNSLSSPKKGLGLGYGSLAGQDFGFIQSIEVGNTFKPLLLNAVGGVVSIGTAIPNTSYTLHVSGSTLVSNNISFPNTSDYGIQNANGNVWIRPQDQYGNMWLYTGASIVSDANTYFIRTNYTTRLYISPTAITSYIPVYCTSSTTGYGERPLISDLYVQSRLQNLVTNGSGLMKNNYNFSQFTFDAVDSHNGIGSFLAPTNAYGYFTANEFIPVDPSSKYYLSEWIKIGNLDGTGYTSSNFNYIGYYCADTDENLVGLENYYRSPGSTDTTLAQNLTSGSLYVYLTDATGWYEGNNFYNRTFMWWPYSAANGYPYPSYTYSRNQSSTYVYQSLAGSGSWIENGIDANNAITLSNAWTGPTLSAGTPVRNTTYGSTFSYLTWGNMSNTWSKYEYTITGTDGWEEDIATKFRPATAQIKLLWLTNYTNTTASVRISELEFSKIDTYALSSSYTENAKTASWSKFSETASYSITSLVTQSINIQSSASWASSSISASFATTAAYALVANNASTATTATSATNATTASFATTAAFATNARTASFATTAAFATNAATATNATNAATAAYASTAFPWSISTAGSGGGSNDFTTLNTYIKGLTISCPQYYTYGEDAPPITITAGKGGALNEGVGGNGGNIILQAGEGVSPGTDGKVIINGDRGNVFIGTTIGDPTTILTVDGNVDIYNNLFVNGDITSDSDIAANNFIGAVASASHALNTDNAISASYVTTASYARTASYASFTQTYQTSCSWASHSLSASFATTAAYASVANFASQATTATSATNATTAAFASTAAFATNATNAQYATNSANLSVTSAANGEYYVIFSPTFGQGNTIYGNGNLTYNVDNDTLIAQIFDGALYGNADTATSASHALKANTATSAAYATTTPNADAAEVVSVVSTTDAGNYWLMFSDEESGYTGPFTTNKGKFDPSTLTATITSSRAITASFAHSTPIQKTLVLCSGFTPETSGADYAELVVPYASDGTTALTYNVKRINFRVATAGGAQSVTVEKSTATTAFSATTIDTVSITSGAYEAYVNPSSKTVASGNKVRMNIGTLSTPQNWTVTVELSI